MSERDIDAVVKSLTTDTTDMALIAGIPMATMTPQRFTTSEADRLFELAEDTELSGNIRELLARIAQMAEDGQTIYLLGGDDVVSPNDAAKLLNMSRTHLCKLLDRGELRSYKVGSHRRIRVRDLEEFRVKREKAELEFVTEISHRNETRRSLVEELADKL